MVLKGAVDILKASYHLIARTGLLPLRSALPFLIVSGPRTGSTLLQTLINSHRNAACMHELLRPRAGPAAFRRHYLGRRKYLLHLRDEDIEAFIQKVLLMPQPPWIHAVGFKILYVQPQVEKRMEVWSSFRTISNLHVIWLTRNELRSVISFIIARETGAWAERETRNALHIDVDCVLQRLEMEKKCRETAYGRLSNSPMLEVAYRDMVRNTSSEMERIRQFLQLPPSRMSSTLRRQNNKPLHEVVTNYTELADALRGTEWEHILEEADDI